MWSTLLFALALFAPGYVAAYCTDLHAFRTRKFREQIAWSVALSFCVGTLIVVAATWLGGSGAGAAALVVSGVAAAAILYRTKPYKSNAQGGTKPYLLLGLSVSALVTASLIDAGLSSHLYMSVTAYDNALRTAFVDAVLRTGVPPASPVYWPGHDASMHYYYYWYVMCAAVARLGHTSARQALIASSTWAVVGVFASLALFGRHFMKWRGTVLNRRWWIMVALLGVTGLDGLIAFIVFLHSRTVARDIEWWSLDQVTSWVDTFLWVPHHAAALVCCMLCVLLVQLSLQERDRLLVMPLFAGVAFASAFGLSTYVAIGAMLTLVLWWFVLLRCDAKRTLKICAISGVSALFFLSPYLLQMLRPQGNTRHTNGGVLTVGVRELLPPVVLANLPGLRSLSISHPHAARECAATLLLLPSYFLELGFFAVALLVLQRRKDKSLSERAILFLTWAGLLVVTVFRSQVIAMNDYSVRASLIPQFLLLVVGVLALERATALTKVVLVVLLVLGLGGSAYQVILLRTYLPIHEVEGAAEYADLSHRDFVLRDAYAEMQRKIPGSARVQFNTHNNSYTGFAHLMNIGRQVIVESEHCNDSFGGEITPCVGIEEAIDALFSDQNVMSAGDAIARCHQVGADYLVATKWDSVWRRTSGWAWTLPVIVDRPDVRVLSCSR